MRGETLIDVLLIKKEEQAKGVRVGDLWLRWWSSGSQEEKSKAERRIASLTFRRADFGLFRDQAEYRDAV